LATRYWIGRLCAERDRDGQRIQTLAWRLFRPADYVEKASGTGWRQEAIRNIMMQEPLLPRIELFDLELQNPMDPRGAGAQDRQAGNPVCYGMSQSFVALAQVDHAMRHAMCVSSHGCQKFTTFGVPYQKKLHADVFQVPRPSVGNHSQRRYRRKKASRVFIREYLRSCPHGEGPRWLPVLDANRQKEDDLSDVMWAGLSRLVRIHRLGQKRRRGKTTA
jgi:hypothetical protein